MFAVLTDPGSGVGPQPLPRRTKQDLLPRWSSRPPGGGAGSQVDGHHHPVPGLCPWLSSSQVKPREMGQPLVYRLVSIVHGPLHRV